ncbi:MAG: hypothetical protein GXP24_13845 [Planctomycetes bacterium]|nr:hypothetical protein [Planctomycetota bacterium]
MKYYANVTESVKLKGVTVLPMAVRRGDFWELQSHVRPETGYFAKFVSDHYDEVLNSNLFEPGMRSHMRRQMYKRRNEILDWYSAGNPFRRTPQYFDDRLSKLLTYYGEDYGHSQKLEDLIAVSDVCFDNKPPKVDSSLLAVSRMIGLRWGNTLERSSPRANSEHLPKSPYNGPSETLLAQADGPLRHIDTYWIEQHSRGVAVATDLRGVE